MKTFRLTPHETNNLRKALNEIVPTDTGISLTEEVLNEWGTSVLIRFSTKEVTHIDLTGLDKL